MDRRKDPDDVTEGDLIERLAILLARIGGASEDADARRAVYALLRSRILAATSGLPALDGYRLRLASEHAIMRNEAAYRRSRAAQRPTAGEVWRHVERMTDLWSAPRSLASATRTLFEVTIRQAELTRPSGVVMAGRHHSIIVSLWLRSLKADAAADRIGYLWLLLEPILHVVFITLMTLFLHAPTVFDMPAYPFAILGVTGWMSFRNAAIGSMFNGGAIALQLDHPPVRRFDVLVAKALNSLVIYALVGMILMMSAIVAGFTALPKDPPRLLAAFLSIWLLGLSYGIVAGSLQMRYAGVRRVNALVLRVIAIMSGLFYVSEQLPPGFVALCLWNPLIHLVQIVRSAWFFEYESTDANLTYVAVWLGGLILLALMCITVDEKRPRQA